jgi:cell shape-determining protein MreD
VTIVVFLLVTLICAALQAAVPAPAFAGHAQLPFLLGVVIYYALTHRTSRMVQAAVLIGISSFCYAAIGLVIARFRETMTISAVTTQAFLGGAANFLTTFVTWLLLSRDGEVHWPWNWLLFKFAGSLLTGAVLVPLIFSALRQLDHRLGRVRYEEHDPL